MLEPTRKHHKVPSLGRNLIIQALPRFRPMPQGRIHIEVHARILNLQCHRSLRGRYVIGSADSRMGMVMQWVISMLAHDIDPTGIHEKLEVSNVPSLRLGESLGKGLQEIRKQSKGRRSVVHVTQRSV